MYTQTFLVTSVRGRVFAPQTAASASLSFFPIVRFSALIVFNVAFVIVVFVVFATVVLAIV